MWSFNDSGGETLLTDCLALSVFSLNTAVHQTRLYTHTHTLSSTWSSHMGTQQLAYKLVEKHKKSFYV